MKMSSELWKVDYSMIASYVTIMCSTVQAFMLYLHWLDTVVNVK